MASRNFAFEHISDIPSLILVGKRRKLFLKNVCNAPMLLCRGRNPPIKVDDAWYCFANKLATGWRGWERVPGSNKGSPTCLPLPSEHRSVSPPTPTVATSRDCPPQSVFIRWETNCSGTNIIRAFTSLLQQLVKKRAPIHNHCCRLSRSCAAKISVPELQPPRTFCGKEPKEEYQP